MIAVRVPRASDEFAAASRLGVEKGKTNDPRMNAVRPAIITKDNA
jgi:hypothetical protein